MQKIYLEGEKEAEKKRLQAEKDAELKQGILANISSRKEQLYPLPLIKMKIDIERFANGVQMTVEELMRNLGDGRFNSRFSEWYASKIYGIILSNNTNSIIDGSVEYEYEPENVYILPKSLCNPRDSLLGIKTIGIKSLTKHGIKLQQNQTVGRGLEWDPRYLTESVSLIDIHIAVDLLDIPVLYFLPFRAADFLSSVCYYIDSTRKEIPENIKRSLFFNLAFKCNERKELQFNEFYYENLLDQQFPKGELFKCVKKY